ncbi:MAG: replicative DNA helicase [Bacteroidota bacterium]|nr:replicative DNA helicase [Bacteroidota bacterium]MDX5404390.1 replicative DNA helicase [Bacteroidota bacterium]MDX5428713.1 replicative DNA helicase [Bacteroidota bacterium]MDX5447048.1 replicative DNA helicase [Bacteroidota bacterium]MDX5506441.1 replicative DNA helicase [Bacteroidota bacterium]
MEAPQGSSNPRKRTKTNVVNLDQGRIPPQAVDLEEAVLGALLIDNSALNDVIDIINEDSFYKDAHRHIFSSIKDLFGRSLPIDILTVSDDLRRNGKLDQIGGEYFLVQLSQRVSSSAHIEYHARIIVQKHIQRELIRISSEIINDAFDEGTDVLELLDDAEQKLFDVANGNIKRNYETSQSLIQQAIERIEEISNKEGLSGIPSGFTEVDRVTSGWQPTDLVIIAARPGMGKTAFVLSMARNMAVMHKAPVAVFSLEMSAVQLITRLISSETELDSEKLRKGKLEDHEWERLLSKVKNLENAPLFIDDTPALSIFDLRAKCRRLVAQHGVKVIVIDYLQLMTVGGQGKSSGNREQEISTISRSLKSIAKELNVPVIALSQLSRAVETRGGSKRPLLSDLRESGAIEQDADIVSFIYRPEYYGMEEWDDDGTPCTNQGEFIIAKHRNGSLENIRLRFEGRLARFSDLEVSPENSVMETVYESKMNRGNFGGDDDNFRSISGPIDPDEEMPF